MTNETRAVGRYGERLAVRHLTEAGLTVLARNWRTRTGEIDIVARDGRTVVFCEVKTRRGVAFGQPVEAVDDRKAARLRRLAAEWLAQARTPCDEVRFDVISVWAPRRGAPRVSHLKGAF